MRSKPMILVALLLAAFLINLDTTLVNVALPAMVRELHASTTALQWVVDPFNLVFAALLLTFGSLSDRFGRKGMLLAGLTVFGAASLAGGFTTDPAQLIAARSMMGLGAAMTFPATLSLVAGDRRVAQRQEVTRPGRGEQQRHADNDSGQQVDDGQPGAPRDQREQDEREDAASWRDSCCGHLRLLAMVRHGPAHWSCAGLLTLGPARPRPPSRCPPDAYGGYPPPDSGASGMPPAALIPEALGNSPTPVRS
jgi:MFS transporter